MQNYDDDDDDDDNDDDNDDDDDGGDDFDWFYIQISHSPIGCLKMLCNLLLPKKINSNLSYIEMLF